MGDIVGDETRFFNGIEISVYKFSEDWKPSIIF